MTDEERQRLSDEWTRNEQRIEAIPINHAERQRLEGRQDEIEHALGAADLEQRRRDR